ncbi:MAG: helix-turn-helix domain-containing protein [Lachnospiraceae bacterium]|nr:helix-turn-helix domain-containing protein [Lachnospiraceae bacterium]
MVNNISERIRNYRIAYPLTQAQLAERSGVSLRSIQLFENGADIKWNNLVKILSALDLDDNIQMLVPDVTERPSYHVKQNDIRKRVSKKQVKKSQKESFTWGDDV